MELNLSDDIRLAKNMRERAYAKYCAYTVGAVLTRLCSLPSQVNPAITAGVFVVALFAFEYILLVGGPKDEPEERCLPCGVCRQFLSEFVDKDFKVYTMYDNKVEEYNFFDLLPYNFEC